MSLTVIGGAALDLIEQPAQLHGPLLGGSGVYAAMAAAPITEVRLVAAVGDDLPAAAFEPLRRVGVDISEVVVLPGSTATWRVAYGDSAERRQTTAASEGAAAGYRPRLSPAACSATAVLLGAGNPSAQLAAWEQLPPEVPVGVDTIDHWIADDTQGVRTVMAVADIIFIGQAEARQLTGSWRFESVVTALGLRPEQALVLKDGERGSWLLRDGCVEYAPAFPVPTVVDATGAGDAFAGVFMAFVSRARGPLDRNWLAEAMLRAAAAGSVVVEGRGVAPLYRMDRDEIETRARAIAAAADRSSQT